MVYRPITPPLPEGVHGPQPHVQIDEDVNTLLGDRRVFLANGGRYPSIEGPNGPIGLHRIAVGAKQGQIVCHLNNNRFDCRRENLRIGTQAENCRDSARKKVEGNGMWVYRDKNGWQVKGLGRHWGQANTRVDGDELASAILRRVTGSTYKLPCPDVGPVRLPKVTPEIAKALGLGLSAEELQQSIKIAAVGGGSIVPILLRIG